MKRKAMQLQPDLRIVVDGSTMRVTEVSTITLAGDELIEVVVAGRFVGIYEPNEMVTLA